MVTRLWKRFPATAALFNMGGVCLLAVGLVRLYGWVQSGQLDAPVVGWTRFMLILGLICSFAGVVALIVQLLLEWPARRRIQRPSTRSEPALGEATAHRRTFPERWRYVRSRHPFTLMAFALLVLAVIAMLVARAFNAHLAFSAAGGVGMLAFLLTFAGLFVDATRNNSDNNREDETL